MSGVTQAITLHLITVTQHCVLRFDSLTKMPIAGLSRCSSAVVLSMSRDMVEVGSFEVLKLVSSACVKAQVPGMNLCAACTNYTPV